eukprot:742686-Pleurochrysis_carterae.AAC.1
MECTPLGTFLHAAISQSPKRIGRSHRENGQVEDVPRRSRRNPTMYKMLSASNASYKYVQKHRLARAPHTRSSHKTTFFTRQLAVAHRPYNARQKRCGAKVGACIQHGENQRQLPEFFKDMRCLERDAIGVSGLIGLEGRPPPPGR